MVRRLLLSFNKEISGVHQAALLLGLASLAAKVLALFRDRLLASTFGAGETLDIYFAAFRIPDFLYTASLLLAMSLAVMPVFMRREAKGREAAHTFISQLSSAFLLVMAMIIGAAFFLMPFMVSFVAPGFSEANIEQLVGMSRILLLSPLLLGFSTLISNVIQSYRKFFVYALSPILYNAGIIVGILVFYPLWGLLGLAWGVILGAALHFLVQVPSLVGLGFFPKLTTKIAWRNFKEVFSFSLPLSVGLGMNQIVLIVVTSIASAIGAGSIAIFQLSYNLYSIPLGVIGLSYSVAAFPALARSYAANKDKEFISNVVTPLKHIIFWATPFVVLFIVLRAHIVRVILGAGAFGWVDTRLTAATLALFSVAILAQSIVFLLMRAFYAAGRVVLPTLVSVFSSLVIISLAFGLVWLRKTNESFQVLIDSFMRVEDISQTAVLMLALAFSIGVTMNAILLWIGFSKMFRVSGSVLRKSFSQNLFAGVILGVIAYGVLQLTDTLFNLQTFFGIFVHGLLAGLSGITAALFLLWLLKNQELLDMMGVLQKKFWKSQVAAPDPRSTSEV